LIVVAKQALRGERAELSRSCGIDKEAHSSQIGMYLATNCFA